MDINKKKMTITKALSLLSKLSSSLTTDQQEALLMATSALDRQSILFQEYEDDSESSRENTVEFLSGQHYTVVTFTNRKHVNRIKRIYESRSSEFKYLIENQDGSLCAKIPLKWVKINPGSVPDPDKPKREMSPEQKEKLLEALAKGRAAKREQAEN